MNETGTVFLLCCIYNNMQDPLTGCQCHYMLTITLYTFGFLTNLTYSLRGKILAILKLTTVPFNNRSVVQSHST